jgi:hypothetical protein
MIEIIGGVPRHADFSITRRGAVCWHGKRDRLRQCKHFEPISQAFTPLRGEPAIPVLRGGRQPISTQGEMRLKRNVREAGEADELAGSAQFDREESEAMLRRVRLYADDRALSSGERGAAKNSITRGSALIRRNRSRSLSCHARNRSRGVSSMVISVYAGRPVNTCRRIKI